LLTHQPNPSSSEVRHEKDLSEIPKFSFQGVTALLGGFVLVSIKSPGKAKAEIIALAYTEIFFACE
jgi:hypothetical protein